MSCLDAITGPNFEEAAEMVGKALVWIVPIALGSGWFWQMRAANRQRVAENYAAAVRSLYKLREMPYRIRRRTSNSPETLAALAGQFHDLQEEVDYWIAWSSTRKKATAEAFENAAKLVRSGVGPHVDDAWSQPFVEDPKSMVLKNTEAGIYKMDAVDECVQALPSKLK